MTHKPKPYINKNKTQHKTPNKKHHQHQHQAYNQRKHKTPDKVPKTIASKHVNAHLFLATVTISTSFDLDPFTNQKRTTATLHTNIKNNLKSKHFKTFFLNKNHVGADTGEVSGVRILVRTRRDATLDRDGAPSRSIVTARRHARA